MSYDASWTSVRNILDPSVIAAVVTSLLVLLLLLVMVVALVVESAAEDGTTEKDTAKWKEKQARINSNLSIGGGGDGGEEAGW